MYQRGPLPAKETKVIAHQDDDDDGHDDNDDDGHFSGFSPRTKSRRIKNRSSTNQSAGEGLYVISKLFHDIKQ